MVAIKNHPEGSLLYGDEGILRSDKTTIVERGLLERFDEFERLAKAFRKKAEESILYDDLDQERVEEMHLFYSAEEFEEFE